jgi:putative restriction endonuclease
MLNFSNIRIGGNYDRAALAIMWGYKAFNALSRGVFTPSGGSELVFFVTKKKQDTLTQYEDHIDQDILYWEGEKGHGNDLRIIAGKDVIHVFFRDRHHSDFVYQGRAALKGYLVFRDRPSKFVFHLIDQAVSEKSIVEGIKRSRLTETEKDAIIKSRRGQGLYRKQSIELWNSCCVTGFTKKSILIASHIRPWKVSSNEERINPLNSLLLVPTLDKLFDRGYLSFESTTGKIVMSDKIKRIDWSRAGLTTDMRLRSVPEGIKEYLDYHMQYRFDMVETY